MYKPKLQNSALPTTAHSKNLLTTTHTPLQTTTLKSSFKDIQPMISSFYNPSIKREENFTKKSNINEQESKSVQQSNWKNTADIEELIKTKMEIDVELSRERNFGSQRYFLGPQRICPEKILPLPSQIRSFINQFSESQSYQQKENIVYGYLAGLNSIYYIIGQNLFIFNIQYLKQRESNKSVLQSLQDSTFKPTILRKNCRKIYELDLPNKIIPKQYQGKVLVLEYPYQIELCFYMTQTQHKYKNKNELTNNVDKGNFVTLVSLDMMIPLYTVAAQFITATPRGELLYIDEAGIVNFFSFSKTEDNARIKRKTLQQNSKKKSIFVSRNKGFIRTAKQHIWNFFDFSHSFMLSKKKNLAMIYDDKKNRIYTLTVKGNRQTIIQSLKKQIKVYEFHSQQNKALLDCIWSISEQQILAELGIPSQKINIFSILKAQPDYNQETDLIILLSNGVKCYLDIKRERLKQKWRLNAPDMESLKRSKKLRSQNFSSITNTLLTKDTNDIARKWSQRYDVKGLYKGTQMSLKAFLNDRSIGVGLVKLQKQVNMYMTLRRHLNKSDEYQVFPIEWKNVNFFHDIDNFPHQNQIYQSASNNSQSESSKVFDYLQRTQSNLETMKDNYHQKLMPLSSNSNEFLRQVHHSPKFFTYLSNKFIANFTLLRPIDVLYFLATSRDQIFCQLYLTSIMKIQPYEICCMLLQIYSVPNAIYYSSKNYKLKIQNLIEIIQKNIKRFQNVTDKSILSKITSSEGFIKHQKQLFDEKQDDELIPESQHFSQQNRSKIRRLFVTFSKLQQIRDSNEFQKISLRQSKFSLSDDITEKIQSLDEEKKSQVHHCMLYISRVVYPFWKAKTLTHPNSKKILKTIEIKVRQMLDLVELLKMQANQFWKHLKSFITKIIQILQIFDIVPFLPENLTLQQAVSKEIQYFEPFIFKSLRRQNNPQMIKIYQQKFPIYISKYFNTLIKIFIEIRVISNIEQMAALLKRLPEYPDYFKAFLKQQKGIKDLTTLKIKDQLVFQPNIITVPQMPFESLINYIYSKVKNTSIKMDEKFMYLKQARKRIDEAKSPQSKQKQVFSVYVIQRLETQYDELYKCLKLQQQCKMQISVIIEQQQRQRLSSKSSSHVGFFKRFFSNLSLSLSSQSTSSYDQKLIRLSKKSGNCINEVNDQIFMKLNYLSMNRKDLQSLVYQTQNSRLLILYMSLFNQVSYNESTIRHQYQRMLEGYCNLVEQGLKKYSISVGNKLIQKQIDKQKLNKLIKYLKNQIKQIYVFLNSTKTNLSFSPLYSGLKHQLSKLIYLIKNNKNSLQLYSVCRELVDLGYDKNIVSKYVIHQNLNKIFITNNAQSIDQQQTLLQRWIYDWLMIVDMSKKYKQEDLQKLHYILEEVKKFKSICLRQEKLKYIKTFLDSESKDLLAIINQKKPMK